MNIRREVLLERVPGLYAVGSILLDGEPYYGAASEDRAGKVFLIHTVTKEVSEIHGGQGGVMAILGAADECAMFCIEQFYPVFDSASAKVVKVTLERNALGWFASNREEIAKIPYVHRIAQLKEEDGSFIAAGRLCERKAFSDDWSAAGSMEIGEYRKEQGAFNFERVQEGIYKHHAMFVKKNKNGYDDLYYGGSEGAFLTERKNGGWETTKLLSAPVSDLTCLDLDGDGKDEIVIIEGFHGDKAVIYKEKNGGEGERLYEPVLELPLNFGHVLWGGILPEGSGLITGSRGGKKELLLYQFAFSAEKGMYVKSRTVIDEGQAPAQIEVCVNSDYIEIVAANHGAGQLTRYLVSM